MRRFAGFNSARLGAANNVNMATSATSVASSAFGSQTYQIRVASPTACFLRIAEAPTAVTTDAYLPANVVEYFTVTPGQKIAGITATGTGLMSVTEITQ